MSVERLAAKLQEARQIGRLPKVVIPVHLSGQPCDMEAIRALAGEYGFKVIEDASHAIGGRYKQQPIGSCQFSDVTIFSFHPVKTITSAEGGMAVTNDSRLANQMARLRSHGITRNPAEMTQAPDGPWYYQQIELGYNYRMTELQAALGLSQMRRLDEFVSTRHALARTYDELLRGVPVKTPWQHPDGYSGLHLYVVRLTFGGVMSSHREVFERLRVGGIGVNVHYIPVYRQPYYARMGFQPKDYPESEAYYAEAISLPMFPGLTLDQQKEVVMHLVTPIGHQTLF